MQHGSCFHTVKARGGDSPSRRAGSHGAPSPGTRWSEGHQGRSRGPCGVHGDPRLGKLLPGFPDVSAEPVPTPAFLSPRLAVPEDDLGLGRVWLPGTWPARHCLPEGPGQGLHSQPTNEGESTPESLTADIVWGGKLQAPPWGITDKVKQEERKDSGWGHRRDSECHPETQ